MQFGYFLTWTLLGTGNATIKDHKNCCHKSLVLVSVANKQFNGNSRYKPGEVSLEKDLILPYVPNVDLCNDKCLTDSESTRNILLFFRGRLKRNAVSSTYQITLFPV